MKNILQEIYDYKVEFVNFLKSKESKRQLEKKISDCHQSRGFIKTLKQNAIKNLPSIIAEIKKASPSKGIIKKVFDPSQIAKDYQAGKASCISVLTDNKYFLGSNKDLLKVKKSTKIPILRKDFIVSEYQIFESKIIGADCILLISEILTKTQISEYVKIANDIDLDVIIEVHGKKKFRQYLNKKNILLGINNRNLKNMNVNIKHAVDIAKGANKQNIICESGIDSFNSYKKLIEKGFCNFLIGEYFMRSNNIKKELLKFSNIRLNNKDT